MQTEQILDANSLCGYEAFEWAAMHAPDSSAAKEILGKAAGLAKTLCANFRSDALNRLTARDIALGLKKIVEPDEQSLAFQKIGEALLNQLYVEGGPQTIGDGSLERFNTAVKAITTAAEDSFQEALRSIFRVGKVSSHFGNQITPNSVAEAARTWNPEQNFQLRAFGGQQLTFGEPILVKPLVSNARDVVALAQLTNTKST